MVGKMVGKCQKKPKNQPKSQFADSPIPPIRTSAKSKVLKPLFFVSAKVHTHKHSCPVPRSMSFHSLSPEVYGVGYSTIR